MCPSDSWINFQNCRFRNLTKYSDVNTFGLTMKIFEAVWEHDVTWFIIWKILVYVINLSIQNIKYGRQKECRSRQPWILQSAYSSSYPKVPKLSIISPFYLNNQKFRNVSKESSSYPYIFKGTVIFAFGAQKRGSLFLPSAGFFRCGGTENG